MKKIVSTLLILILTLIPTNVFSLNYPSLHYKNAIVYDLTDDKILYELNSKEQASIASLTKLLTIITAIENNQDLNKTIVYTQNMKNNVMWYASVVGFKVGDKLTLTDLLYGAMLPSGADATVALAITTSGSIESFVTEMNNTAKRIGMTNSNFVNVHGLDADNHYSTAEDIRKLLEYSLENELFKKIYTTKEYTLSTGKVIKSTIKKTSEKEGLDITKILGSKIGTTGNAGLCISVLINHKNHEIIIVTLGASQEEKEPYNLIDVLELTEFIENNYSEQILSTKETVIKGIKIINSKSTNYEIKTQKNISKFLENDYNPNNFKVEYNGLETLSYKNIKGEKLGTIKYLYEGIEIDSEDIYLNTNIEPDYFKIIYSNRLKILVPILVITTIITIIFATRKKYIKNMHYKNVQSK